LHRNPPRGPIEKFLYKFPCGFRAEYRQKRRSSDARSEKFLFHCSGVPFRRVPIAKLHELHQKTTKTEQVPIRIAKVPFPKQASSYCEINECSARNTRKRQSSYSQTRKFRWGQTKVPTQVPITLAWVPTRVSTRGWLQRPFGYPPRPLTCV
jgi:hypothetical protein